MHRRKFFILIFSALLVFAVIASQGCGGGSKNSLSGEKAGSGSVVIGGDTILENFGFDTNGNGKPDFLDFDDVSIVHVQKSSSPSLINVQTPAMIFLWSRSTMYSPAFFHGPGVKSAIM